MFFHKICTYCFKTDIEIFHITMDKLNHDLSRVFLPKKIYHMCHNDRNCFAFHEFVKCESLDYDLFKILFHKCNIWYALDSELHKL